MIAKNFKEYITFSYNTPLYYWTLDYADVLDWCNESIGKDNFELVFEKDGFHPIGHGGCTLHVSSLEDLLAFKLRWNNAK